MVVFRPVAVVCHSLSGGECCDPSRTDHVISVRQVDVSEDRLWAGAHSHETTPLVVFTIFTSSSLSQYATSVCPNPTVPLESG